MYKNLIFMVLIILFLSSCKDTKKQDEAEYFFSLKNRMDLSDSIKLEELTKGIVKEYLIKTGKSDINEFKLTFKRWSDGDKNIYRVDLFHPSDIQNGKVGGGKSISLEINFLLKHIKEYGFQ